jgi:hypothetical protein
MTMVQDKDLKRLVRARMSKTGESYTAARAQIVRGPQPARPAPQPAVDFGSVAGQSEAVIKERTGRSWKEWVQALDWHGAEKLPHREIAEIVKREFNVADWWTQTVTVGYERIKGLRVIGQRRDGSYEASKSRTFGVPVKTLFEAWATTRTRRRWLNEAAVKVRGATSPKSMRLGWSDDTIVVVGFLPKGKSKSAVAVQHTKLPSRDAADRFKKYWSERLDVLEELLGK